MTAKKKATLAVGSLAAFLFVASTWAADTGTGRIIPKGKVALYRNGQVIGEFTSGAPLPHDVQLMCRGRCAVKTDAIFFVAEDRTRFMVVRTSDGREIDLQEGTIYFALAALPEALTFVTPHAPATAEAVILNAATGESFVKGYVSIGEHASELGIVEGGALRIRTAQNVHTVAPGETVILGQLPKEKKKEDEDDKAAAAVLVGGGTAAAATLSAGTLAVLGAFGVAGVIAVTAGDDDAGPASPFVPPPGG